MTTQKSETCLRLQSKGRCEKPYLELSGSHSCAFNYSSACHLREVTEAPVNLARVGHELETALLGAAGLAEATKDTNVCGELVEPFRCPVQDLARF